MPTELAAANLEHASAAWASGIAPPPRLTVSEWADSKRVLSPESSANPGQFHTSKTPYVREIADAFGVDSPIEVGVLQKASQIGGTEIAYNLLGYVIEHAPAPVMLVYPTTTLAERASKQRVATMIESTPALRKRVRPARERDSDNTILAKGFPGGILIITGANSATGLRSMPARYLIMDELDAYPRDIDGEGDPVQLAIRRTATYGRRRKVFLLSTPKIAGSSRIAEAFDDTDKRQFEIPCPYCGAYAPILFGDLQQPGGAPWSREKPPETVVLLCQSCSREIREHQKTAAMLEGDWIATAEGKPNWAGWHLPAYYSPVGWYSWKNAVDDFLEAVEKGPAKLKTWTNTVAGETWEEKAKRVPWRDVLACRVPPFPEPVPEACTILTAGVDVQGDRLELAVWAFGKGERLAPVDHRIITGDPHTEPTWLELFEQLTELRYRHPFGLDLAITAAGIDSGYATDQVYEFCSEHFDRRFYCFKGFAGANLPALRPPNKKEVATTGGTVELYPVGVDPLKVWIYNRLTNAIDPANAPEGAGKLEIPARDPFGEDWARQLVSEESVPRMLHGFEVPRWQKRKGVKRNEVLDCAVYARAALLRLNPAWDQVAAELRRRVDQPDAPQKIKKTRRRRRWATDY